MNYLKTKIVIKHTRFVSLLFHKFLSVNDAGGIYVYIEISKDKNAFPHQHHL